MSKSSVGFHSKLKVFLDKLRSTEAKDWEICNVNQKKKLKTLKKAANARVNEGKPFGLPEALSVNGISEKTIEQLLDEPLPDAYVKSIVHYGKKLCAPANQRKLMYPKSVLSWDLGTVVSSYCLLNDKYEIQDWGFMNSSVPVPYSTSALHFMVQEQISKIPKADVFVIETQTSRRKPGGGFMFVSLQLKLIELAIYGALMSHCSYGHLINPKMVANYFSYRDISSSKKKNADEYVRTLLEKRPTPYGNTISLPDSLNKMYSSQKKKDDLSDSLLQAVAFMEWTQITRDLEGDVQ